MQEPELSPAIVLDAPTRAPAVHTRNRWLGNMTAGTLSALVTLSYSISYGALVFSGPQLQPHATAGLQAALMAAWVVALVVAWGSTFRFAIAGPDSNATAILAVVAGIAADAMAKQGVQREGIVATVLALLTISAAIVGVVVFVVGAVKGGKLVRYLPFPVIGGFLAGTGFLILSGGFKLMTGHSLSMKNIFAYGLQTPPQAWFPALAVAAGLLVVPRFQKNVLVMPGLLIAGVGLFYGGLWFSDMDTDGARAADLLFARMAPMGVRQTTITSLHLVHWDVLLSQWDNIVAMTVVVIITILMNSTGLDLSTQTDVDIDRELRINGIANVISGILGGMIGYVSISRSLLNFKSGASSRSAGYIAAGLCFGATFIFTPAIAYFPRPVLAGLLIFLGLSMLREWVWEAYFKLPLLEYELLLSILLLIVFQNLIVGVASGMIVASIFFAYSYSRTSCIKHTFTVSTHFSNKERPIDEQMLLKETGGRSRAFMLQGYIFFGTSSEIVNTCREFIDKERLQFLLLDFRLVQGLDASAVFSFAKLEQLCNRYQTTLTITGLRPEIEAELKRTQFIPKPKIEVMTDIDRGLEWIEDRLLAFYRQKRKTKIYKGQLGEVGLRDILAIAMDAASVDILMGYCEPIRLRSGTGLFRQGELSDALYFLESGELSVLLPLPGGLDAKRLRSFSPGTVVGEMGLYCRQPRSADVVTDMDCKMRKLTIEQIEKMEKEHPEVAIQFHIFVVKLLAGRLYAANEEIRQLL